MSVKALTFDLKLKSFIFIFQFWRERQFNMTTHTHTHTVIWLTLWALQTVFYLLQLALQQFIIMVENSSQFEVLIRSKIKLPDDVSYRDSPWGNWSFPCSLWHCCWYSIVHCRPTSRSSVMWLRSWSRHWLRPVIKTSWSNYRYHSFSSSYLNSPWLRLCPWLWKLGGSFTFEGRLLYWFSLNLEPCSWTAAPYPRESCPILEAWDEPEE